MAKRPGTVIRLATPLKAWAQRFVFVLVAGAAFGVMLLGKADVALVERVRSAVQDAVAPLLGALSRPVATINGIIDYASEMASLRAENEALRAENARLQQWQIQARELMDENGRLRDLLNFAPDPSARFVSARVIGDQGGAFVRSLLLSAGSDEGVRKGQAVMTGDGLVGRVAEVGGRSSRVLLLTDINSRIPVLVGPQRNRAVLVGDNSAEPDLEYLGTDARPAAGDYVITSGSGGVLPAGLPVGVVSRVSGGVVSVAPFVDWDHLEAVRIVDFGLPGLIVEGVQGEAEAPPAQGRVP